MEPLGIDRAIPMPKLHAIALVWVSFSLDNHQSICLAGRYLGNYIRWPIIHTYHNLTIRKSGGGRRGLKTISNPNLIYVGQILMIPGRGEQVPAGPKPPCKASSSATAIPLDINLPVEAFL